MFTPVASVPISSSLFMTVVLLLALEAGSIESSNEDAVFLSIDSRPFIIGGTHLAISFGRALRIAFSGVSPAPIISLLFADLRRLDMPASPVTVESTSSSTALFPFCTCRYMITVNAKADIERIIVRNPTIALLMLPDLVQ
jgi:hypothetical protein